MSATMRQNRPRRVMLHSSILAAEFRPQRAHNLRCRQVVRVAADDRNDERAV